MKNKTSQIIYAYWNDVRKGRRAPLRFDIEPARIGTILPDTFILEHTDEGDFRFRLAGTRICERFGDDVRGSSFFTGWQPADQVELRQCLREVTENACVQVLTFEATPEYGRAATYELTLLPLIHTRGTIDRIMGSISTNQETMSLFDGPYTLKELISHETIWPDGRPYAVLQQGENTKAMPKHDEHQSPFLPHIRTGRLVRQDRRQFRVYEGGLSSPSDNDH